MSSVSKMPLITLLLSLLFIDFSIAGYVLEDDYSPSNFFDMFSFFTSSDPTHGFVDYVDQSTAQSQGYISTTASTIYIGTDHDNVTPNGRPSVRLTSNKAYNSGSLIILDLAHMPGGICGTWPAFWMVGPNWPSGGEIDIIEGVNEQSTNAMTLHTGSGCSITNNGNFTGSVSTYNCDIDASGQSTNAGCSIDSTNTQSYGTGFNSIGGGVYATEWTDDAITVWFFPRGSIPSDIAAGTPSPSSSWGTPSAQFQGGCDIPEFFQDNQIVFDLTYCGDWAGASSVWGSSSCSSSANTCEDYVQNNPSAFQNAYWSINSLQTFQYSEESSYTTSSSAAASSTQAVSSIIPVYSSSTSTSSSSSSSSSSSPESTSTPWWIQAGTTVSTQTTSSASESSSESATSTPWWIQAGTTVSSTATTTSQSSTQSETSTPWWIQAGTIVSSSTTTTPESSAESETSTPWWIQAGTTVSASLSLTGTAAGKAVSHITQAVSPLSSASSPSSTVSATTLSKQVSSTTAGTTGSSVTLSTIASSADGSVSTAVPTSQAEILAKVEALAEEWSTSQPSSWQDEINELEDALEAASSQAAAVSAKLEQSQRQNQRRHLMQHKRRFSGHH